MVEVRLKYSYEITARPADLVGGRRLRVHDDHGEEVAGGIFPVENEVDPRPGMDWWNGCSQPERAYWLMMAVSARPADAYHAFLLAREYAAAEAEGQRWVEQYQGPEE